ncbi:MAG: TonB-dependent receptor [Cytophagales bacterium]|nr:TonB-dependent receptor [Cytophagales bacterium]
MIVKPFTKTGSVWPNARSGSLPTRNIFSFLLLFLFGLTSMAQSVVSGKVTDGSTGEPLVGATVVVKGTTQGVITGIDGSFELSSDTPPPYDIEIRFTGFATKTLSINSSNITNLAVPLDAGLLLGQEVVISASRRREKVQEAPASVSVLSAESLEATPNPTDVTRNLINVAGVQVQQQSANRINISMRGGSGLFGTSVFPIMDYRSLIGPGIGTFQTDQSGINGLDIDKIEIVRGAGSALYGPGVTQGVVHFITKSPIDKPGTAVELVGGELNTWGGAFRHGTKISDKFGFKITGQYRQGDEFTLDPDNADDAVQIARFQNTVTSPTINSLGVVDQTAPGTLLRGNLDVDGDGNPMADDWFNAQLATTLEFRPKDDMTINVSGGFNQASSVFYNEQGEGLAQATEYWGQARAQIGGLFVQFFGVSNDGGSDEAPTFLYQTGLNTSIARTQFEAQAQYNFDTPDLLNANWTAGFDYRFAGQDTQGFVYGRQEEDDDFSVVGGYVQGKFVLSDKFDLVAAARYDRFNFIDDGAFSPRAALVYKAAPNHTFRASYNRSTTTVSNLQLNIDFPLSGVIPGSFDVWLKGNKSEQTFSDNATIDWFTGLIPSIPYGTEGAGLPLAVILGQEAAPGVSLNDAVIAGILAALAADPATAPLVDAVAAALGAVNPASIGFGGTLSPGFNIFDGSPLGLQTAPISQIATQDTWEIGYKGVFNNKIGVSVDLYRVTEDGNSQFTAISPAFALLGIDGLGTDLGNNAEGLFTPALIAALQAAGLDEATATATAASLGPVINGAYTDAGNAALNTPSAAFGGLTLAQLMAALPFHATVETEQVPQGDGITHLAAGYRTFDSRTYYGWDLGIEYYVNADLSFFGNYSGVDRTDFMQTVRGDASGQELPSSLNIPKNKFRLGANYTPEFGIRANVAFQHDDSFNPIAGQFSGDTGDRNLVDAGVGYKFDFGIQVDVTATNLFNNEYRYYQNMPFIGRRMLAKIKYEF